MSIRVSVVPAAPYFGGKRLLARRIIQIIEATPHDLYAEPFVGMGGVFLRRNHPAKCEVINDMSRDVSNLFRILQRHYPQFLDVLKWQLTSRADFERLVEQPADTLTDLERSARFLYLQKTCFGGKLSGRNFGVQRTGPARFDVTRLIPILEDIHTRLAPVVIECLPYQDFIPRYDRAGALFYLDPPYFGCERDYGADLFGREDFERIADLLAQIKGRFILSINDRPEIRQIFAAFRIEAVETTYSIAGGGKAQRAAELIITG